MEFHLGFHRLEVLENKAILKYQHTLTSWIIPNQGKYHTEPAHLISQISANQSNCRAHDRQSPRPPRLQGVEAESPQSLANAREKLFSTQTKTLHPLALDAIGFARRDCLQASGMQKDKQIVAQSARDEWMMRSLGLQLTEAAKAAKAGAAR